MSTTQTVIAAHRDGVQPLNAEGLQVRLKAERVQEPRAASPGDDAIYLYEFSVNQLQPVTIEVPLVVVTFHGQPSWDVPGGKSR